MEYNRYRIAKPEHGSQDWLNIRFMDENGDKRISASAAAAIYGLHRFVKADEYAAELLSDTPPVPLEPSWAMTRGNDLEPLCMKWATDKTGVQWTTPEEMFVYNDERGARLISTLDGFFESENGRLVLEIKTFNRPWDGELPDYWRIQGIQQAICADVDRILWAVFDSSLSMQYHTQEVSEEEKEEHITKASEWLAAIDMNMTPPGVTWSFESVAKRYTAPERGSMLEIGEQHAELVAQLKHVKSEMKSYKELEDKLKAELCELIGNHDGVTINGETVATWKGQSRSSFNTKLMQLEHPDIVDKYTTNITVRTLLLKGAK